MDTDKTSLRLIRRIGGGGKDSPEKHKGKRAKQQQEQDMLAPRDPATGSTRSAGNQGFPGWTHTPTSDIRLMVPNTQSMDPKPQNLLHFLVVGLIFCFRPRGVGVL